MQKTLSEMKILYIIYAWEAERQEEIDNELKEEVEAADLWKPYELDEFCPAVTISKTGFMNLMNTFCYEQIMFCH